MVGQAFKHRALLGALTGKLDERLQDLTEGFASSQAAVVQIFVNLKNISFDPEVHQPVNRINERNDAQRSDGLCRRDIVEQRLA